MYVRLLIENCPYQQEITANNPSGILKILPQKVFKRLPKLLLLHVQWQHTSISMLVHRAEYSNLPLATWIVWNCVFPSQEIFTCSIDKVEPKAKRFGSCNQEQLKDILGSRMPKSTKKVKVMHVIYMLISVTAVDLWPTELLQFPDVAIQSWCPHEITRSVASKRLQANL